MKTETDREFLQYVKLYVEQNPQVAPYVSECVALGLKDALDTVNERAADMEVALVYSLQPRTLNALGIMLKKITKWQTRSAMNWDSELEKLKAKHDKKTRAQYNSKAKAKSD